jgi:hypothetical protein
LPAPAPGLTPAPSLTYPMTFGAFNALTAAGGRWNLFVNDLLPDFDPAGSNGRMTWTLTLTAGPLGGPQPPPLPIAAPQAPTMLAPGAPAPGALVNTFTPTFTWTTVPGAAEYQILIRPNVNGQFIYYPWMAAASVVNSGGQTASYTQPTPLAPGTYEWWIAARNTSGTSHLANGGILFATPNAGATSPTQPISPNGVTSATPTYRFTTTLLAQDYQILLIGPTPGTSTAIGPFVAGTQPGGTIDPGNTGIGTIVQPTPLAPGNYTWYLQTQTGAGWAWSYPMNFSVP